MSALQMFAQHQQQQQQTQQAASDHHALVTEPVSRNTRTQRHCPCTHTATPTGTVGSQVNPFFLLLPAT